MSLQRFFRELAPHLDPGFSPRRLKPHWKTKFPKQQPSAWEQRVVHTSDYWRDHWNFEEFRQNSEAFHVRLQPHPSVEPDEAGDWAHAVVHEHVAALAKSVQSGMAAERIGLQLVTHPHDPSILVVRVSTDAPINTSAHAHMKRALRNWRSAVATNAPPRDGFLARLKKWFTFRL